jgi:O-methyltransferase involved in polyketide biosynthesis
LQKYHIEKNTVQETLVIPLDCRKVCSERFPQLFSDPEAERLCSMLDYDFSEKGKGMGSTAGLFGALEVAQRQYDLMCEVRDYLKTHPKAAVVNLGCGLDDTFSQVDNGRCRGYNLDMPDVIAVRNELLPAGEREQNIGCDLNDHSWMDRIDASGGAVFFASGVFYYFETEAVKALFRTMAVRFPGADAVLLTYWGSTMTELPAEGTSWSANLPAGLLACFGEAETGGTLPVNIPALDEHYQPTDEIFRFRGEPTQKTGTDR